MVDFYADVLEPYVQSNGNDPHGKDDSVLKIYDKFRAFIKNHGGITMMRPYGSKIMPRSEVVGGVPSVSAYYAYAIRSKSQINSYISKFPEFAV